MTPNPYESPAAVEDVKSQNWRITLADIAAIAGLLAFFGSGVAGIVRDDAAIFHWGFWISMALFVVMKILAFGKESPCSS